MANKRSKPDCKALLHFTSGYSKRYAKKGTRLKIKIGIFGTYLSDRKPRKTIGQALAHSAANLGVSVEYQWIENDFIESDTLQKFQGIFIAPGSAMENISNIIRIIKEARETNIPCLGTCGGFQIIVTEFAKNVLGIQNIEHKESNPNAVDPLFSKLQCNISSSFYEVLITKGTKAFEIYKRESSVEGHYCNYGLNPKYEKYFSNSVMKITGIDKQGVARIVELNNHPFFIGTLFVPQVSSSIDKPHAMITAFVNSMC